MGNEERNPLSTEAEQIVVLTLVVENIKDKNLRLYKAIVKSGGWQNKDKNPKATKNPTSGASRATRDTKTNKS